MTILAKHVGHRTTPLDDRRLRCLDCSHTIVITQPSSSTSTSTPSAIPGPGDPRCPHHPHEHAASCRPCAADRKANPDNLPTKPLGGWAATATAPAPRRPRMPVREPATGDTP